MARMSGFVYQDRYLEQLKNLTDQELGRLVRALSRYHMSGEVQELKGRESMAYDFIRYEIDEAERGYQSKCETNKKNRSGANENGGKQSMSNDNDRQRPLTTVNDREQSSTTVPNITEQNINKQNITECVYEDEEEEERARERLIDPDWKMVAETYQREIGMLPMGTALDVLTSYVDDLGGDVVCKAIEITNAKTPDNPHQFLIAILKNFDKNGIDSREKAEAYLKDRERRIANDSRGRAQVRGTYQTAEIVRGSRTATGNADGEGGETLSPSERSIRESFDEYLRSTHI